MAKLGELLKAEREKKGLSLHEVGMNLKINPKILKALEEGTNEDLPAKTFLRGFVKSYAQYLRLDIDLCLSLFQEEYNWKKPEVPTPQKPGVAPTIETPAPAREARPAAARMPSPASSDKKIYVVAGIVLCLLIASVIKVMSRYERESKIESQVTTTTTTLLVASASLDNAIAAVAISSDLAIATTTTLAVHAPSAPIVPVASTTTTTMVAATTTTTTTTLEKPRQTELIVEALNKVTIHFSLAEGKWDNVELNPDQVHTFRTRTKMILEVSDGGAVNVIVNGRDKGVPGTIGKPIKLSYP